MYGRRKVVIVATGTHDTAMAAAYAELGAEFSGLLDDYTDEQLAVIADYTGKLIATTRDLLTRPS